MSFLLYISEDISIKDKERCIKKSSQSRANRTQACIYNVFTMWSAKTTALREEAKRKNALILPELKS